MACFSFVFIIPISYLFYFVNGIGLPKFSEKPEKQGIAGRFFAYLCESTDKMDIFLLDSEENGMVIYKKTSL